jgi:hypothetical protein
MAKESSLAVVVVVTSKLRLALDEDPCINIRKNIFVHSLISSSAFSTVS